MYTVDKTNSTTKIKAEIKAMATEFLLSVLREKYGEDNVKMVRTGNASKSNEIAVIVDEATGEDGEINPIVITLNPAVKEFSNHTSDKGKVYIPFDFFAAANEYDNYVEEKEAKAQAAKEAKAAKAAKDAEKRKAKSE